MYIYLIKQSILYKYLYGFFNFTGGVYPLMYDSVCKEYCFFSLY